ENLPRSVMAAWAAVANRSAASVASACRESTTTSGRMTHPTTGGQPGQGPSSKRVCEAATWCYGPGDDVGEGRPMTAACGSRPVVRAAGVVAVLVLLVALEGSRRPWARAGIGPPAGPKARPAKGKMLVSGHGLGDPNFAEAVVLLLAVDEDNGAMGVIVNQPTPIKLGAILPESKPLADRGDRVWRGGPVLPTSLLVLVPAKSPP